VELILNYKLMNYFQNLAAGSTELKMQLREGMTNTLEKGSVRERVAVDDKGEGRHN
jgi:hypothetical protein